MAREKISAHWLSAMKNKFLRLLATLAIAAHPLCAQNSDTPVAKGLTEDRLARALKMFPDADVDKDGKLTLDEALKYIEAHPELKQLIKARALDRIDSKTAKTVGPDTRSTPASVGLPAGPR